jgi:ATP-dependent DNA ligase
VTAKDVPAGDDWLHEPKLDGYRLQVAKHGRVMRLYSRRGYDWSKHWPSWQGLCEASLPILQWSMPSCASRGRTAHRIFSDC